MNRQGEPRGSARQQDGEARQSLGTIRRGWRMMYSVIYVSLAVPFKSYFIWFELVRNTADTVDETVRAILLGIMVAGGAALVISGTFVEGLDIMLGTRDFINDWLQRKREEAEAKGIEEGVAIGRETGIEETLAWVERRDEARDKGEPFDEPPPGSNQHEEEKGKEE